MFPPKEPRRSGWAFCGCKPAIFLYIEVQQDFPWGFLSIFPAWCCHRGRLAVGRAMQASTQERRAMRRFDMRLPAIVRIEGTREFHTETQNVSARGVFFYLDRLIEAGTRLEITLTFPPHVTLTDAIRVRFFARVIRVEDPLPSARVGVAAMIEQYEFLQSNGSANFFSALQSGLSTAR